MKALAKEVDSRYQWASEMHDDLQDFLAQTEPVYNAKALATWMRAQFVVEMRKGSRGPRRAAQDRREAMNADKGAEQSRPRRRPRGSSRRRSRRAPRGPAASPQAAPPPMRSIRAGSELEAATSSMRSKSPKRGPAQRKTAIVSSEHENPLLNEKTSIVAPGQSPTDSAGAVHADPRQPPGGSPEKGAGDLAALSTGSTRMRRAPPRPRCKRRRACRPPIRSLRPWDRRDIRSRCRSGWRRPIPRRCRSSRRSPGGAEHADAGHEFQALRLGGGAGGGDAVRHRLDVGHAGGNHTGMMMLPNGTIIPFAGRCRSR